MDKTERTSLDTSTPKPSMDNPTTPQTPQRASATIPPAQDVELRSKLDRVLQSDIGVNTLLTRLKQSITSAREFSSFLKERATLEEKHLYGIQRLTRTTQDVLGRPDNRQGSFAHNYRELGMIHERMAKNSEDFAHSLVGMSEELQDIAAHCERGRKQWKHTGLEAEQRAQDADSAMEKAKQKYYSLAEQYDRVRTGERQGGKFGLKGPKSAAQREEDLFSKAEGADQEYRTRVEAAQNQRHELLTSSRPQAIRELQNYIMECDAAVGMQLQKFAVLNEKLLLGNGLCVSPLKGQDGAGPGTRSLREIAQAVDNQKDLDDYVMSHSGKVGSGPNEIRYEKHPALIPVQHHQPPPSNQFNSTMSRTDTGFGSMSSPVTHDGQTSGIAPSHMNNQSNPYSGPQGTNATSAPQLPQIGALPMGGRGSMEAGRAGYPQGRVDNDYRDASNPSQHRPNQPSYSGQSGAAAYPPTAYQQPARNEIPVGSGLPQRTNNEYPPVGPGLGRGQPPSQPYGSTPSAVGRGQPPQLQYGSIGPGSGRGQSPQQEYGPAGPGSGRGQPYQPTSNNYGSVGPAMGRGQQPQPEYRSTGPGMGRGQPQQEYGTVGLGPGRGQPSQDFGAGGYGSGRGQPSQEYGSSGPGRGQSTQDYTSASPGAGRGYSPQQEYGPPGSGVGRGQSPITSGPPTGGPLGQNQYQQGNRGPLAGQPNDFGTDGRGPQLADPRGLPSQSTNIEAGRGGTNNVSSVGTPTSATRGPSGRPSLPPHRPVFGVSLDELFHRDGAAVPTIVFQCVQAVDLFGLHTEGVYRISGSAQHIMELQALFDHDSSKVDFRTPGAFYNDIASVTTLLKHFLRDLPDPLMTSAQYNSFIQAAKIDDDIVRRDSLHAIINSLPDPNYATLRTLVLHLHRVAQNSAQNRMTASNIAIVFGPTLMGSHNGGGGGEIQDAGWQARVIETILRNTLEIFDDDD